MAESINLGSLNPLKQRTRAEIDHGLTHNCMIKSRKNICSPSAAATSVMREQDIIHPTHLSDLIKMVKDNYQYVSSDESHNSLIRSVPLESKVESRTLHQFGYISKPVNHTWEKQYEHFKHVLRSGHFSINQKPYESIGNFRTDPRSVFLQNFDDEISLQIIDKLLERQSTALARRLETSDENKIETEKKLCDFAKREKECQDAGLHSIKQLLGETNSRIVATRAGQPYMKHVQQCNALREEQRKILALQKSDDEPMLVQDLSHTDILHTQTGGPVKITTFRSTNSDEDDFSEAKAKEFCRKEMKEWKQEQKLNKILLKFEYIYYILCSLYNIRARYLKSKNPLSTDVVVALRRNPFNLKSSDRAKLASRGTHTTASMESRLDIKGTASVRASGNALLDKHHSINPSAVSARKNSTSGQISHLQNVISNVKRNSIFGGPLIHPSHLSQVSGGAKPMGRQNRLMTLVANQDVSKVETWEDLLNVGNKTKILRLLRKSVPPWQIPITNNEPVKSTKEKDEKHLNKYHPDGAVNRMRASYLALKERIVKNQKHDLEKLDRERIVKFRYKLQAMQELEPLVEFQKEILKQVSKEAVRDPVLITEETIPWYDSLIQEATQLGVRNHPDVSEYLGKIEKFLLEELSHIPSVKEKLCLLTVSLPISEICTPHVQHAIQFVLIEILDGTLQMLQEWLNYRKLYVIKNPVV